MSARTTPETRWGTSAGAFEMLRAVDQLVPCAVLDTEGNVVEVTSSWCRQAGWPAEEVSGSPWRRFVHPDDVPGATLATRRASWSHQPVRHTLRLINPAGETAAEVRIETTPLFDEAGSVGGWLVVTYELGDSDEVPYRVSPSERQQQAIFDALTDAVIILEPEGRLRMANTAAHRLFRLAFDGNPWSLIHPSDKESVERGLTRLMKTAGMRSPRLFEHRVRVADGGLRWLETEGVNLSDDPNVGAIVVHSRDVTERHEAEEKLRSMASRLTALVSHLSIGVVMVDEHSQPIFINQALTELFSIKTPTEELVKLDRQAFLEAFEVFHCDTGGQLDQMLQIIARRQRVIDERVELSIGLVVARSFVPIWDGGTYRGHLWLYRDITDVEAAAAAREERLALTEARNQQLTELDVRKTDLLASVSHELRTPLTSIASFTQLLRDGLRSATDEQIEFLDIIERNTGRLVRLVDDLMLLDLLEMHTIALNIDWVDLPTLADMAVSSARPRAETKGIRLSLRAEPGPELRGDPDRLGQLFDNLLTNAIKFTPVGGSIDVVVACDEGAWRFDVSDDGIGVPPDEVGRLFLRFFQASNAKRGGAQGSGLGLSIALRVAELHRGTIEVHPLVQGTRFRAVLRDADDLPVDALSGP